MLVITGHLEGQIVIQRMLDTIEGRMSDMTPAWPSVLRVFRGIMRTVFATEGASTGRPWPELAESTVRERERKGFSGRHPILARTHVLERALTTEGGASVIVQLPKYFAIAVDVDYFKFHQSNKPRKRTVRTGWAAETFGSPTFLPRRAPISFTQDDKTKLLHPIRLYVTGRMQ